MDLLEKHKVERILIHLDNVAEGYNVRWGRGRLVELADKDLADKFNRQLEKIKEAASRDHAADLEVLSFGLERGWKALEDAALASGHKPLTPACMEVTHESGEIYKIVCNNEEQEAMPKNGVTVVTMRQLVNVYHATLMGVFKTKDGFTKQDMINYGAMVDDPYPFG